MIGYLASTVAGFSFYSWLDKGIEAKNQVDKFLTEKLGKTIHLTRQYELFVGDYTVNFHLEHWMYLLLASTVIPSDYFTYFAIGGIIQDVSRDDFASHIVQIHHKTKTN